MFEYFDSNFDAVLTKTEVSSKYSKIRNNPVSCKSEIDNLFEMIDVDHSNQISYSEFLMVAIDKKFLITRKNVEAAFKLIDTNDNGAITKDELLFHLGMYQPPTEEWKELMYSIDKNRDEQITLKFFGIHAHNQ
eukprot:CAMPEP_0176462982 /NCGR_PEP_ID=MMETSP0127-20121128/35597_1 /TAXON_ID=938130 /ORGANISM="Platyophrya macrostoma, Strain WH" /LENGTH=133 /DNA_ID=CAMNT_0017855015 /DNA_START=39 /DNA_END=440 /DNA_ORIENTATION=-